MKKNWLKISGRVILRGAIFLAVLEIFFRAGGFLSEQWKNHQCRIQLQHQADVRIICLGDSITAIGEETVTSSGKETAYPVQLEEILNQRDPEKVYHVFNLARAGQNSSYSANNIENWIDDYQPDYVVMMLGAMDQTEKNGRSEPLVLRWIKSLRVVQTLDVLKEKAASRVFPSVSEGPQQVKTEMEYIWAEVDKLSQDKKAVSQTALYVHALGQFDFAEKLYRVMLGYDELKGVHAFIRTNFSDVLWKQKKYDAYVRELKDIPYYSWKGEVYEQLCPQPKFQQDILMVIGAHQAKHSDKPYYEEMFAACYQAGGDRELAAIHQQKARELRRQQMNPFTERNYRKILAILAERSAIQPVLVQYPLRDLEQLKELVQGVVGYDRFIFVDNQKAFEQALKNFSYSQLFSDRAAGDFGHGTAQGNRLIAENIADAILNDGHLRIP
ncbi:MAG TPA: hypothetical protein VLJ10_06160 [Candidatus Bathyarchaeia archaeon]|nr:hypothetical protein [Candidatus Bathyarchaeia archaeon]